MTGWPRFTSVPRRAARAMAAQSSRCCAVESGSGSARDGCWELPAEPALLPKHPGELRGATSLSEQPGLRAKGRGALKGVVSSPGEFYA